jgi:hypothetical protein
MEKESKEVVLPDFTESKGRDDIKIGDILVQDCHMISDYTGETSIEPNRLLVDLNPITKRIDVKCIDACVGHRNCFWGYVPKFDRIIGNVVDGYKLPSEVVFPESQS